MNLSRSYSRATKAIFQRELLEVNIRMYFGQSFWHDTVVFGDKQGWVIRLL